VKEEKIILGLALIILSISMIPVQSKGQSEVFERLNRIAIESNVANGLSDDYLAEIPLFLNYTLHEPILITNDDELAEIASNGTGTENDPFIISGWNFNYIEEAVFISGTTVYFVIKECLFKSNISYIPDPTGIRLENIANETVKIENNIFQDNTFDITIVNSDGLKIFNNSMVNSLFSLDLSDSNNNQILDNDFFKLKSMIHLYRTSNNLFCNNSFLGGEYSGISLYATNNITIHDNYFEQNIGVTDEGSNPGLVVTNNVFNQSNRWGLYLSYYPSEGTIANNKFVNSGIFFFTAGAYSLDKLNIYNNTVNGLPLGWITYENNIILTENYGQLFLISCSEIIVENQVISNCSAGIILVDCYDIIIRNNTLIGCFEAIKLCYSKNIDIYNNSCFHSDIGISCVNSLQNVMIYSNNCSFNWFGISLESEVIGTVIENNLCMYNTEGIIIHETKNTIIINNTLKFNIRGIHLEYSSNCDITYNRLALNNNGIYAIYSSNNLIFNNKFIDNYLQAYEYGGNNLWCNLEANTGNYWSDYSGSGSYKISGSAEAEDYCPLNEQMVPYPGAPFNTVEDTLDDEQPLRRSEKFELGSSENPFVLLIGCCLILFKKNRTSKNT